MCPDAYAYSQVTLFDIMEKDVTESVLYARQDGKKIGLYEDKECFHRLWWAEDTALERRILEIRPLHLYTNNNSYTYDRVEWIGHGT